MNETENPIGTTLSVGEGTEGMVEGTVKEEEEKNFFFFKD